MSGSQRLKYKRIRKTDNEPAIGESGIVDGVGDLVHNDDRQLQPGRQCLYLHAKPKGRTSYDRGINSSKGLYTFCKAFGSGGGGGEIAVWGRKKIKV